MGLEQGNTRRLDVYCQPLVEHDSSIENSKILKKKLICSICYKNWKLRLVFIGRSNTFNKIGILEILAHFSERNLFLTSSSEQSGLCSAIIIIRSSFSTFIEKTAILQKNQKEKCSIILFSSVTLFSVM